MAAVQEEASADQEKCTTLFAQSVDKQHKSRSSLLEIGLFIAETAF